MITFDHASCGVGRAVETLFGVTKSGIADQEGHELFNGALFANGLASDATGRIALAATRERSIHYFEQVSEGLKPYKKIAVAGGPDNLSVTEGGDVVAAVHPSMIRLALHRKLGLGAAPSRVIEISADGTSVSTLFDDASGELFSGATVGVMIDKCSLPDRRRTLGCSSVSIRMTAHLPAPLSQLSPLIKQDNEVARYRRRRVCREASG